jgi:hypothetical protein
VLRAGFLDRAKAAGPIRDDVRSRDEVIACHGLDRGPIMSFDEMDQDAVRSTLAVVSTTTTKGTLLAPPRPSKGLLATAFNPLGCTEEVSMARSDVRENLLNAGEGRLSRRGTAHQD